MNLTTTQQAFFALVRAGLWIDVNSYGTKDEASPIALDLEYDWGEIYQLAEDQSVVGLVATGIETVQDAWFQLHGSEMLPRKYVLKFIGNTLHLEQKNRAMNKFMARLIRRLRERDVHALLIKGHGIGQCYAKPSWRICGDIDLLLDADNYETAKKLLLPLAQKIETEDMSLMHQGMTVMDMSIELHGTLHSRLSKRIEREIDNAQRRCLVDGEVRVWHNGKTDIFLPDANNDVIFIFTHILHHFFIDGVGLRQICDWCRLLWTFRDTLDVPLLEQRLRKMGLMSEWKAFAAYAVGWLGMPVEAMPFYDARYKSKGDRIMALIYESGNFGKKLRPEHPKDSVLGKVHMSLHKLHNFARVTNVFPLDSVKFCSHFIVDGFTKKTKINEEI